MTPDGINAIRYFVTTLGQIAGILSDFGFRDESVALEKVRRELQNKLPPQGAENVDQR
jgi:hypothetical protein